MQAIPIPHFATNIVYACMLNYAYITLITHLLSIYDKVSYTIIFYLFMLQYMYVYTNMKCFFLYTCTYVVRCMPECTTRYASFI